MHTQGLWSRFTPGYNLVRKELAEKTLGDVKLVRAELCIPYLHVERFKKLDLGGGGCVEIASYVLSLACMVFGEMPESVAAMGNLLPTGKINFFTRSGAFHRDSMNQSIFIAGCLVGFYYYYVHKCSQVYRIGFQYDDVPDWSSHLLLIALKRIFYCSI